MLSAFTANCRLGMSGAVYRSRFHHRGNKENGRVGDDILTEKGQD